MLKGTPPPLNNPFLFFPVSLFDLPEPPPPSPSPSPLNTSLIIVISIICSRFDQYILHMLSRCCCKGNKVVHNYYCTILYLPHCIVYNIFIYLFISFYCLIYVFICCAIQSIGTLSVYAKKEIDIYVGL